MNTPVNAADTDDRRYGESRPPGLKYLLAVVCCLILGNIYYAQPIIADISRSIGLEPASGGAIVTMAQVGYCVGVLFLVPLGDMVNSRRLIVTMVFCSCGALIIAGFSNSAVLFLAAMFFSGLFSSAVQIIIPLSVGLAADEERGQVVGLVMSGAILGIVLSRPAASWLTGLFGWRFMYFSAAVLMMVVGLLLFRRLPDKSSSSGKIRYPAMLLSMVQLLVSIPGLCKRLYLPFFIFASFTIFWSAAPLVLQETLHFSHFEMALFSLVSLAAPFCAIMAGRTVDRGHGFRLTIGSILMVAAAFLVTPAFGLHTASFILAVLLLDPGVHMTNVVIQQSVLSLIPEARSRLNALCISFTFTGGAIGSWLGPWLYNNFGWTVTALAGVAMAATAFILNLLSHTFPVKCKGN